MATPSAARLDRDRNHCSDTWAPAAIAPKRSRQAKAVIAQVRIDQHEVGGHESPIGAALRGSATGDATPDQRAIAQRIRDGQRDGEAVARFTEKLGVQARQHLDRVPAQVQAELSRLEDPADRAALLSAVELDRTLADKARDLDDRIFRASASIERRGPGDLAPFQAIAELSEAQRQIQVVRAELRRHEPALGLIDASGARPTTDEDLHQAAKDGAKVITENVAEARRAVDSDDVDLWSVDRLVADALKSCPPADRAAVETHLEVRSSDQSRRRAGELAVMTILSAAAIVATGGAAIGIGLLGAVVGGASSAIQLEAAGDQLILAEASLSEEGALVDRRAAKEAYLMAMVNGAMAAADLALAAKAFRGATRIAAPTSRAPTIETPRLDPPPSPKAPKRTELPASSPRITAVPIAPAYDLASVDPATLRSILGRGMSRERLIDLLAGANQLHPGTADLLLPYLAKQPLDELEAAARVVADEVAVKGHSLIRHGPHLDAKAVARRVTGGISPDGKFVKTDAATQFKSFRMQDRSRKTAIAGVRESGQLNLAHPPGVLGNPPSPVDFVVDYGKPISKGRYGVGEKVTQPHPFNANQNVSLHGRTADVPPSVTRVVTRFAWDGHRWKVVQHFPTMKTLDPTTGRYSAFAHKSLRR